MISMETGVFDTPAKNEIIVTMVTSSTVTKLKTGCRTRPSMAPRNAPVTMLGAKAPPAPPEPRLKDVARILAKKSMISTVRGVYSRLPARIS